jgi:hypothetical protein
MGLLSRLKRRPPAPPAPPAGAGRRILVACPDHAAAAGGVRQLYRLVATLRAELGLNAFVYHQRTGFRLTWFDAREPVLYADATAPGPDDVWVIPEVWGGAMQDHPGIRKVIFNQNAYYTFMNGYQSPPAASPLNPRECGVRGIITVSDDNVELLQHTFPELPAVRLRYAIDPAQFYPPPQKERRRIAFMPRKHGEEARQVLNTLALRGSLAGFEVVAIDGASEAETADLLRSALIFLSFGYPEGFSLPPAEAMACGCLTIGYHGMGAREFLRPEVAWPIATGDILGYVRAVEAVMAQWRQDPAPLAAKSRAAAASIHAAYSFAAHRQSIRAAWAKLPLD